MPSARSRKPKWEEEEEEEELEEELGDEDEDEDEDEEEDYEDEEGLGPPGATGLGPAALFPRKAPPPQAFRGDGGPRALGGQERPGGGPAPPGGAAHTAPPLQPPDHGDWTYEEQFKQVGRGARPRWASGARSEGSAVAGSPGPGGRVAVDGVDRRWLRGRAGGRGRGSGRRAGGL